MFSSCATIGLCSITLAFALACSAGPSSTDGGPVQADGGGTMPDSSGGGGPTPDASGMQTLDQRLDGQHCTETTMTCDPNCQSTCGANANCVQLCCPTQTMGGTYCGGICQLGASACTRATGEDCYLGWDTCDHTMCANRCGSSQSCYDACCGTMLGHYCGGSCTASCGGGGP